MMNREKGFTLIELLIVVAIIGILAAIAIPTFIDALNRARQTTTIDRMISLGANIEQYIMDYNSVGSPKVGNDTVALQAVFLATEINLNDMIMTDGWGTPFNLENEAGLGNRGYTITSFGMDMQAGPAPSTPGVVKRYVEDIVWTRGKFTQSPEGAQSSK